MLHQIEPVRILADKDLESLLDDGLLTQEEFDRLSVIPLGAVSAGSSGVIRGLYRATGQYDSRFNVLLLHAPADSREAKTLTNLLTRKGLNVYVAWNAEDVKMAVRDFRPDVSVMLGCCDPDKYSSTFFKFAVSEIVRHDAVYSIRPHSQFVCIGHGGESSLGGFSGLYRINLRECITPDWIKSKAGRNVLSKVIFDYARRAVLADNILAVETAEALYQISPSAESSPVRLVSGFDNLADKVRYLADLRIVPEREIRGHGDARNEIVAVSRAVVVENRNAKGGVIFLPLVMSCEGNPLYQMHLKRISEVELEVYLKHPQIKGVIHPKIIAYTPPDRNGRVVAVYETRMVATQDYLLNEVSDHEAKRMIRAALIEADRDILFAGWQKAYEGLPRDGAMIVGCYYLERIGKTLESLAKGSKVPSKLVDSAIHAVNQAFGLLALPDSYFGSLGDEAFFVPSNDPKISNLGAYELRPVTEEEFIAGRWMAYPTSKEIVQRFLSSDSPPLDTVYALDFEGHYVSWAELINQFLSSLNLSPSDYIDEMVKLHVSLFGSDEAVLSRFLVHQRIVDIYKDVRRAERIDNNLVNTELANKSCSISVADYGSLREYYRNAKRQNLERAVRTPWETLAVAAEFVPNDYYANIGILRRAVSTDLSLLQRRLEVPPYQAIKSKYVLPEVRIIYEATHALSRVLPRLPALKEHRRQSVMVR